MHFGGLEDDRKDSTAPHITFGPQLGRRQQCGLAICTFHLGFSLVLQPQMVAWSVGLIQLFRPKAEPVLPCLGRVGLHFQVTLMRVDVGMTGRCLAGWRAQYA